LFEKGGSIGGSWVGVVGAERAKKDWRRCWELLGGSWWLWEWLESGRIHPYKEENENKQKAK